MAEIITRLKFETDEFHNRARRAAQDANEMAQQLEVAGNKMATTNEKNLKLARSFGHMQTVSTTLRGKISELSETFVSWGHLYNSLTEAQKREPYGKAIVEELDHLKGRISQTKDELAGLEGKLNGGGGSGFGQKFMQGMLPGLGMGVGAAGAMYAVKATQTAINAMKETVAETVRTNMEFEQSNANLAAVLGKTTGEITKLTENAKSLGATTIYTANEVTELQTVLARRGFNQDQILQMTHGITNLAVATGTDLAQSAELAGSTMQSFGMKASQMERITAALGVSTTKSALTTEALGVSLQYVAPTARAAGFSLEDTIAMLGVLVDSGINASTAGTALRQIILGMSTDNGKLAKSFGYPVRNMEDFIKVLDNISKSEDVLSKVSKEVRVTAGPALIALANNKDRLESLRDSITGVEEDLEDMRRKQIDTLQGSITILNSAWNGLMLSFSSSNGNIKVATDAIGKFLQTITKWSNRDNGGDAAIATYAWNEDEKVAQLKKAQEEFNEQILNGKTVETIREEYDNQIAALKEKQAEMRKAYDEGLKDSQGKFDWGSIGDIAQMSGGNFVVGATSAIYRRLMKRMANISSRSDAERGLADIDNQLFYLSAIRDMADPSISPLELETAEDDDPYKKLLKQVIQNQVTHGDPHAEAANKIKADYSGYVSEIDRDSVSEKEYTEQVYQLYHAMYEELENLYADDLKRKYAYTYQKHQLETKFTKDIYKINLKEQKAALEAQAKEEIEGLDKTVMGNREYADKVYDIRKKLIEDLIRLYEKDPAKKAEQLAALSSLNSQHNGSQRTKEIGNYKTYTEGMEDTRAGLAEAQDMLRNSTNLNEQAWATDKIREYAQAINDASAEMRSLKNFQEDLGSVQSVWSNFTSGIDAITSCVETMQKAVEGDANAWDVLRSVIDTTFSVMQSVASIIETINTLKSISSALTMKETVATAAHTAAETADAAASGTSAAASGADAVAKGAKAVSWIPIVGPILAVAAIAAIAGGIMASRSKTEYHADGGKAGNPLFKPRGTDTVPAMLSPGEIILNKAQQTNVAAQLQPSRVLSGGYGGHVTFEIDGRKLIGTINNEIAATGGGRAHRIYSH